MTVKELCELDWTITGLDIDVRNPTKLVETIRIGQTVRATRYDKFKSEDGDIEIYERNLGVGQPLTIIRREIQWYNKPEKNKKGQTDTRKVGVDLSQIPKHILGMTITNMTPSNSFMVTPDGGGGVGLHGYRLWCLPNGFEVGNFSEQIKAENPENVTIDDLIGDWERRMKKK